MKEELPLRKLIMGLLTLDCKIAIEEQEYEAIGAMTLQRSANQKRYQYSQDLERAITEAKLTTKLLSTVTSGIVTEIKSFEPEDLINYYNGVFLEFVHQIKDKILRLVWWMIQDVNNPSQEPQKKIGLGNFKSYNTTLKNIGILNFLNEWGQDSKNSGIAVCLEKRSYHHHFLSSLQLNSDFLKIRLSKTMLAPTPVNTLTEYGKTKMKKIGEEAYKKWREEITANQLKTLKIVEENINAIASYLIEYYKIPVDSNKQVEIINKFLEIQKAFDIENKTSIRNISAELRNYIDTLLTLFKELLEDHLISVYIVGSVSRGEFIPNSSDINLIILTDFKTGVILPENINPLFNIKFFSEKEFLSEKMKKYRFICKYDGVLIDGKSIELENEKFPKIGASLALLLNKGFIEELENIKNTVMELKNPNSKIMRFYSLKVVRIMLDFNFGIAMANKPYYTSSRKERIQYIKEMFPSNLRQTLTLEGIYYNGIIRQQDFQMVIDTFLENAKKNYEKMTKFEEEILKNKLNS